jgi:hypothetical protein
MFSRLDPALKGTFRVTEETDTWMGIRQDEEQGENRKRKEKHEEDENPDARDEATVSIDALTSFLTNMMYSENPLQEVDKAARNKERSLSPEAKAASAYQKMADKTATASTPSATSTGDSPQLSSQEKVLIARLIEDLKYLSDRGVTQITIGRTDSSLLEGFIEAAETALKRLD